MSQTTKFSVAKLNGLEDYTSWKFAIKMLLIREKRFKYTSSLPEKDDSAELEKDQEAFTLICLHLEPHLYPYVQSLSYAKEVWDALAAIFEDKGINRRISLMNNLLDNKLENHKSMHEYVASVMSHAQKLKEINQSFDDDLIAVVLLRGLPDEYRPLRMALEHSGMKLTSENVRQKLLQEDSSQSSSKDALDANSALVVTRKQIQHSVLKLKCFRCGQKGHKKADCSKLVKEVDGEGKSTVSTKSKKVAFGCSLSVHDSFSPSAFYLDSGASNHMSFQKHWFRDFMITDKNVVTCANNDKMSSEGKGDIMVRLKGVLISIKDCYYVPGLKVNLLSISKLVQNGWKVIFDSDGCRMFHQSIGQITGKLVVTASEVSGIYKLDDCFPVVDGALATVQAEDSLALWHRRLGHVNLADLQKLPQIELGGKSVMDPCVACIRGKAHRLPFPKGEAGRATDKLGLLHADLCGPMSERSYGGARYMFIIVDDVTRKMFVYFLREKSQTLNFFKEFVTHMENETGLTVKRLRTDNGTEFVSKDFNAFLSSKGIRHQLTVPYTAEQNGVAERSLRSVTEMARTMLMDKALNQKFWAEACNTAVYVKNRLPHSANNGKIPEELWTGKVQKLNHMRVFGSTAYVHIPKEKRKKWDAKANKYIFVGYCEDTKGYRFADFSNPRRIITGRDVTFIESSDLKTSATSSNVGSSSLLKTVEKEDNAVVWEIGDSSRTVPRTSMAEDSYYEDSEEIAETAGVQVEASAVPTRAAESEDLNEASRQESIIEDLTAERTGTADVHEAVEPRYPLRNRLRNAHSGLYCYNSTREVEEEPRTYKEALQRSDSHEWQAAMERELASMKAHDVWKVVEKPPGTKIVGNKWIYKYKFDAYGNLTYKARLVAKGFTQSYGVDYFETFSPVVRRSTLRLLLALAAENDLKVHHFDVNTAFLNGDLHEKVYMQLPEGFDGEGRKQKVCLLQKAIYGLKQASRSWNEKVNDVLLSMSFTRSELDSCLYYKDDIFICLYVDDFIIFFENMESKQKLLTGLRNYFQVKDLEEARQCLGMSLERGKEGTFFLHQKKFIDIVLKDHGMNQCKPAKTPLELDLHKVLADGGGEELNRQEQLRYQSLVGALNYLACNTRPDISAAVSFLAQYNSCCRSIHMKAAKRVLRYLQSTRNLGLVFRKSKDKCNGSHYITGYVDADWGGDIKDRKSYSGFIFKVGANMISWECRKQNCVSLSSSESEYVSLSEASKEAVYLQRLVSHVIKNMNSKNVKLFVDNQSAISMANNPVAYRRTKHIDIRYNFVRHCVNEGLIRLEYIPTEDNLADALTKPLPRVRFERCVYGFGLALSA